MLIFFTEMFVCIEYLRQKRGQKHGFFIGGHFYPADHHFFCVAEYEGFAKASDYLYMTQSAVSKSIAKMEKELGIELFQRTTREIHLTDAGKILYHDWNDQVRAMHDSYIRAASLHAEKEAVLHIGLLNTARPERYFWNLEERFKKEYPNIQLELSSEYMTDLEDPARAVDMSLSMRERHWGSVHHIWEDIGLPGGAGMLVISFEEPGKLGYDTSRIDTDECNALVCANVKIVGDDETPDIPVVMTHFLRPVEGGSQLQSMFWFGYQIIDGKAVKCIPDGVTIPKEGPMCLLNHNVKEFSNLAKILPELYAQEKDHWEK